MAHILALRFSALGDVAMTIPVLASFAKAYPEHEVTLLSRGWMAPLFEYLPKNVHFRGVNLNDYKGIGGLLRLFRELKGEQHYDYVADLHDVMRTQILRLAFMSRGVKVAHVDKGRKGKRGLVRASNKVLAPLKPMEQRYADVFRKLGFPLEVHRVGLDAQQEAITARLQGLAEGDDFMQAFLSGQGCRIGIAPFAQHEGKIYPLEMMERVIECLGEVTGAKVFLFGAGPKERTWCEGVSAQMPYVVSMVGRYKLDVELAMMSRLDVMLTMDSANMHLASLCGVPTVSIWGATHPFAGFTGLQQEGSDTVQLEMPCRPCSVFGNKPCRNGSNHACMRNIRPEMVAERIIKFLSKTGKCPNA